MAHENFQNDLFCSYIYRSGVAQLVERSAVNRKRIGSSPIAGAIFESFNGRTKGFDPWNLRSNRNSKAT